MGFEPMPFVFHTDHQYWRLLYQLSYPPTQLCDIPNSKTHLVWVFPLPGQGPVFAWSKTKLTNKELNLV